MSEAKKFERFGRYLILDHLVDGGMAKICRARFLGEQAEKIVAIKMVQPQFSQDPSFKAMFNDEIKITFNLIHPNVIQTYDYGEQNKQLFVAMEYCDGRNLKEYLEKLKERGFVFPVQVTTYIISQVCMGLHYAHTYTDKLTGKPSSIVHRDISPHNIMLTYDGGVKVIDFGIAKSSKNSEATQAGTIKGKLSYLAPEYLEGLDLDCRYDEFAVGITMWEMLCGRKLFSAKNDLAILKKIQECVIPVPSSINPNVPKELDEIVMKSLSKDRNKRYENCDQFGRALNRFLYTQYKEFNPSDISAFAQELFIEDIKRDREKFFEWGRLDVTPYLEDLKKEISGGTDAANGVASVEGAQAPGLGKTETKVKKETILDFGFEESEKTQTKKSMFGSKKNVENEIVQEKGNSTQKLELSNKKSGPVLNKNKETTTVTSAGTTVKKISTTKVTSKTTINKRNQEEVTNSKAPIVLILLVASCAYVYFFQYDLISSFINPKSAEVRSPASDVKVEEAPKVENNADGEVRISNFDKFPNARYFINGVRMRPDGMGIIRMPTDNVPLSLRVEREGKAHYFEKFKLSSDTNLKNILIGDTEDVSFGYLVTSQECVSGTLKFMLFNEVRTERLPIKSEDRVALPAGVEVDMSFVKSGETVERNVKIKVENGVVYDFCEELTKI